MSFEASYNKRAGFLNSDYALARSLLPEGTIPAEVYKQMYKAKFAIFGKAVSDALDEYIHMPRELAYTCIRTCTKPYLNLSQIVEFLSGSAEGITDPYTDKIFHSIMARMGYERKRGIFIIPDDLESCYSAFMPAPDDANSSARYSRFYPYAMAEIFNKTLDDIWVLYNSYNIIADAKFTTDEYLDKMHKPNFDNLAKLGEICLSISADKSYLDTSLVIEQCPDNVIQCFDGFLLDNNAVKKASAKGLGKYIRCYNASPLFSNTAYAFHTNLEVKLIEGRDKCYFTYERLEKWLRQGNLAHHDKVTLLCEYNLGSDREPEVIVSNLVGLDLADLPTLVEWGVISREVYVCLRIFCECTYQFNRVVERIHTGKTREVLPTQGTPQPHTTGTSLRSLIKYTYADDDRLEAVRGYHKSKMGTHAKPCEHIRREHKRRLRNGRVITIPEQVINKGRKPIYKLDNPDKC